MGQTGPSRPHDVLILGGGIVGLACAEELARRGKKVVVLERHAPGGEASWAAGGMLAADYEGEGPSPLADLGAAARERWPAFAERLGEAFGHGVGLVREGTLAIAFDEADLAQLHARLDWLATAKRRVEWIAPARARELEPRLSTQIAGGAFLPDDAVVNNRAVLLAQAAALRALAVEVVPHAQATLWIDGGRVRGAIADGVRYEAGATVNAAGAWASQLAPAEGEGAGAPLPRFHPVRGQMIQFQRPADAVARPVRWEGGYVIPRGAQLVVGSTMEPAAGFDKRVTDGARAELVAAFARALPSLARPTPTFAWAGLRPASADGLPAIGAYAPLPGLFFAAGLYRNGILFTPAVAEAIADLLTGRAPGIGLAPFDPARPSIATGGSVLVNGETRAIAPSATVGSLLEELALRKQGIAVALNEEVVRRGDWDTTPIRDRDRVEIIHAVGGG